MGLGVEIGRFRGGERWVSGSRWVGLGVESGGFRGGERWV